MIDKTDIILQGLAVTVEGISIVFLILIIIMLVIEAMEFVFVPKKAVTQEQPKAAAVEETVEEAQADDGELIAVISAAVAAYLGSTSSQYVVKSYKRVGAWNQASRRSMLENKI